MFALVWWAYPVVAACTAVPMGFFYWLETRREKRADAAYDAVTRPCTAHVGTDRDGTELWCWQKAGHSGAHDDYDDPDVLKISSHAVTRNLLAQVPAQGVCGNEISESDQFDYRCVRAPGHLGECSDF